MPRGQRGGPGSPDRRCGAVRPCLDLAAVVPASWCQAFPSFAPEAVPAPATSSGPGVPPSRHMRPEAGARSGRMIRPGGRGAVPIGPRSEEGLAGTSPPGRTCRAAGCRAQARPAAGPVRLGGGRRCLAPRRGNRRRGRGPTPHPRPRPHRAGARRSAPDRRAVGIPGPGSSARAAGKARPRP